MSSLGLTEFERLYRQNYSAVRGLCGKYRLSSQQTDDAIQDTFVKAWEKRNSLKEASSFKSWVMMIARNECLMHLRAQKDTVHVSGTDNTADDDTTIEYIPVSVELHATLEFEQNILLLQDLIRAHKKEPRATIAKLFYLEKLSISEICEKMKIKQNTVLSHLRRFRILVTEAMLTMLEDRDVGPYLS